MSISNPSPPPPDAKVIRERLGWSQTKMATWLGVHQSTISRLEADAPRSGPIRRLLEELEKTLPPCAAGSDSGAADAPSGPDVSRPVGPSPSVAGGGDASNPTSEAAE